MDLTCNGVNKEVVQDDKKVVGILLHHGIKRVLTTEVGERLIKMLNKIWIKFLLTLIFRLI